MSLLPSWLRAVAGDRRRAARPCPAHLRGTTAARGRARVPARPRRRTHLGRLAFPTRRRDNARLVETLSVALFILGLLVTLAGVVFVFLGRFDAPPDKEGDSLTAGDVRERLNGVIEKLEKRYRWGIVMLGLGQIGRASCRERV